MSGPLVSVVIPVYNGAEYLEECLRSVCDQTYPHWNATIVDNCSSDGTGAIADRFAAADSRFRVLHSEDFLEQVPNINRAVRERTPGSHYTKILLADDWIFPRCLEEMVDVAERHPRVGIVSSYRLDDTRVNCDELPYPSTELPGAEVCRRSLMNGLFVFGSPSTLLFREAVVREREPFYSLDSLHEDTEACYEILSQWDFGFVHQVLSFTRRQNESLTAARRVIDSQHQLDRWIMAVKMGPRFLEPDELSRCLAARRSAYYEFLGGRVLYSTGERFWAYHREGLASVGVSIDRLRLARAVLRAALRELGEPAIVRDRLAKVSSMLRQSFSAPREPSSREEDR